MRSSLSTQEVTTAGTNLDDYTTDGTYYFSQSVTPVNIPAGVNGYLKVMKGSSTAIKQIWYRQGTPGTNDYQTYVRTWNTNGWGAWNNMWMVVIGV